MYENNKNSVCVFQIPYVFLHVCIIIVVVICFNNSFQTQLGIKTIKI